jgi:hypothetical protein
MHDTGTSSIAYVRYWYYQYCNITILVFLVLYSVTILVLPVLYCALVAKVLVEPKDCVPVRLMNVTDAVQIVRFGTTVAELSSLLDEEYWSFRYCV